MARGRKAQPDEVKRAKGKPVRRPLDDENADAMPLPPVMDQVPSYLSKEVKTVWARVAPYLTQSSSCPRRTAAPSEDGELGAAGAAPCRPKKR